MKKRTPDGHVGKRSVKGAVRWSEGNVVCEPEVVGF